MAIYRLDIQPLNRNAGRRATAAAAYRAGERIRDEASGQWFNHTARTDVRHREIILPSRFRMQAADASSVQGDQADMSWARDRSGLWNAAERAERRRNSVVAREFMVALPHELNSEKRRMLAQRFATELADRYKVAVDLTIHAPREGGDQRNHHAHLLATTREIAGQGLGAKAGMDMRWDKRRELGLSTGREEYIAVRERWASLANEALKEAHVDAHIDHRSLAAQGIDREPTVRMPFAAFQIERQGGFSTAATRLREAYRARVQARLEHGAERLQQARQGRGAEDAGTQRGTGPGSRADVRAASTTGPALDPRDLEAVRRQARETWLRLRQGVREAAPQREMQQTGRQGERIGSAHGTSGDAGENAFRSGDRSADRSATPSGPRPPEDFSL